MQELAGMNIGRAGYRELWSSRLHRKYDIPRTSIVRWLVYLEARRVKKILKDMQNEK